MKITYVKIENWRSIKCAEFAPADVTILVGSNNAGKTNILSAINFVLGERWPMPANLLDSDFYSGDRSRDIKIILWLDHPVYSKIEFDLSRDQYNLQAYSRNNVPIRGFNNAARESLAFAYVDAARSFDKQFSLSRWTLFGQALRTLHGSLRSDGDRLAKLRQSLEAAHELLKTEDYQRFESKLKEAFAAQLKTARYDVRFEFRAIDESNLYRSLYPTLLEGDVPRNPVEVGSGVRNLLVLALFQAFAKTFKGDAVLGIEEPELYLHPHAQRSLMRQFDELAAAGNQLFVSSHSPLFLDITRSDRIVLVDRCEDEEGDTCTQVRTSTPEELLALRQALHPERQITLDSMRAFLRNVQRPEMTEGFFSRLCVLVEGQSETEALPIYARYLGFPFDENGVSIVFTGGKTALDTVFHIYKAHSIPTYVIFDNDEGGRADDIAYNRVMCRLLNMTETSNPAATVKEHYAILGGDWEKESARSLEDIAPGLYEKLVAEAREGLGLVQNRNKPLVARYVAQALIAKDIVPPFAEEIVNRLKEILEPSESSDDLEFSDWI